MMTSLSTDLQLETTLANIDRSFVSMSTHVQALHVLTHRVHAVLGCTLTSKVGVEWFVSEKKHFLNFSLTSQKVLFCCPAVFLFCLKQYVDFRFLRFLDNSHDKFKWLLLLLLLDYNQIRRGRVYRNLFLDKQWIHNFASSSRWA